MANQTERVGVTQNVDILTEMQALGAANPDVDTNSRAHGDLENLTSLLLANNYATAVSEYERFLSVKDRSLDMDMSAVRGAIEGKRVLVTGGTGCIGRVLLSQLLALEPAQVVSLESSPPVHGISDVEYAAIDLRDREVLRSKLSIVKPDIVYHLAAQRNIATAQENSLPTLTTNISGTRNLIDAAEQAEVTHMVYASSDKAMPPLVGGTYAVSKKAGEWLMSEAAVRDRMICTAARLTHVVDNSVIFNRLHEWAAAGSAIRLFSPDISMHVQSAAEAAQLLLGSCLDGEPGYLKMQVLKNLGRPISLLHLALGTIAKSNSLSPIYFRNPDHGGPPQPEIFQPGGNTAAPLLGGFEAPNAEPVSFCNNVISLLSKIGASHELETAVNWFSERSQKEISQDKIKMFEDSLSWDMFEAVLQELDKETLYIALDQAKSLHGSSETAGMIKTIQAIADEK
jgi:nucleoside-diphosphate-sugar epimerase